MFRRMKKDFLAAMLEFPVGSRHTVLLTSQEIPIPAEPRQLALTLLRTEVSIRPLHSCVAVSNVASIRVREKDGFQAVDREVVDREAVDRDWALAAEHYTKCEEETMELSE